MPDLDIPNIIYLAWTTVVGGLGLLGWVAAKLGSFLRSRSDESSWWGLMRNIASDTIDALDQEIDSGKITKEAAGALAVEAMVAALTESKSPKKVKKLTGQEPKAAAKVLVESAVNKKRAAEKAIEAGAVTVGPR